MRVHDSSFERRFGRPYRAHHDDDVSGGARACPNRCAGEPAQQHAERSVPTAEPDDRESSNRCAGARPCTPRVRGDPRARSRS